MSVIRGLSLTIVNVRVCGCDPPVDIEWSSEMVKILSVVVGSGNVEEANWRPRITAVENVLNSWRQRSLSYGGRALVINALVLSRVWYVASLIHVPRWIGVELNYLVFKFFWGGKRDLVGRRVVVQLRSLGGFAVVDFFSKVSALHVQWVRRFIVSPPSRVSFMVFWFSSVLGSPPHVVFSAPGTFALGGLPPSCRSLFSSWVVCRGSLWASGFGIGSGIYSCSADSLSCKSAYWFLLSELVVSLHYVETFFPLFGSLHWSATWHQLFLFDLDRPVIDLSWKVAHGDLYTAECLSSFGYDIPLSCFCSAPCESLQHLFFDCPLAVSVLSWLQSFLFCASPLSPSILVRHVLFGFSSDELRVVPRVFVYLLNVRKFSIWWARNDFCFHCVRPSAVDVMDRVKAHLRFHLPLFFNRFSSDRRRRFFVRQWGARGYIASIVDGHLFVHI